MGADLQAPQEEDDDVPDGAEDQESLDKKLARLRREKAALMSGQVEEPKAIKPPAAIAKTKTPPDEPEDLEAQLARLREENDDLKLDELRKENEVLKKQLTGTAALYPVSCG